MNKATQIGWFTLKEDKIFRNSFECAAWYEDVLVKAGRYPVLVYDLRVSKSDDPVLNGVIKGHIGMTYTHMDGTTVSDEFGARFCGVPIGSYDNRKNADKPSSHSMATYMHEMARSIVEDPETPWELLPEYKVRVSQMEWKGEPYTSRVICKVEKETA